MPINEGVIDNAEYMVKDQANAVPETPGGKSEFVSLLQYTGQLRSKIHNSENQLRCCVDILAGPPSNEISKGAESSEDKSSNFPGYIGLERNMLNDIDRLIARINNHLVRLTRITGSSPDKLGSGR